MRAVRGAVDADAEFIGVKQAVYGFTDKGLSDAGLPEQKAYFVPGLREIVAPNNALRVSQPVPFRVAVGDVIDAQQRKNN